MTTDGTLKIITNLQTWRLIHFGTTDDLGNAADTADPDNDGTRNLLEFFLNGNPNVSATTILPVIAREGNDLTLTYTRNKAALTQVTFAVKSAAAPDGPWSVSGISEIILSDDGTVQQVKATTPITGSEQFLHLEVSRP